MFQRRAFLFVAVAACAAVDGGADDGIDDQFLTTVTDGSPEAIGVLAVANTLTRTQLDDDVGLDARAATKMVAHRDGADALLGTSDDDPFDTLAELDAIPYVGKVAFAKLLAYAQAHGFVPMAGDGQWHLEHPMPDAKQRLGVWAISATDAWSVGAAGLAEHWDGTAWHDVATSFDGTLTSVWASGPNDVWVVGERGTVLRWNGSSFAKVPTNTTRDLYDVHGTSATDVWIVGDNDSQAFYGLILHWTGASFTVVHAPDCPNTLYTVFAASATDVWVGGAVKTACHFDGATWSYAAIPDGGQETVTDIWRGTGPTVWAVYAGELWRRSGTTWSFVYSLPNDDPNDFTVPSLARISGTDNDLWASGSHGYVVHWNGTAWTPTRIPGNAYYADVATTGQTAWAVGDAALARLSGATWTESYHVITRQWLWSTSATSATNAWSIGSMGDVVRRTAGGWQSVASPLTANDFTRLVYTTGDHDAWIVGDRAAHWDGTALTVQPALANARGMYGTASNLWSASEDGKLAHYDGATWTIPTTATAASFYGMGGSGPNDIYAVGTGTIAHYDGMSWTKLPTPMADANIAWSTVVAIAPNDVWVAGEAQSVRHWNGTTWQTIAATTSDRPWLSVGWAKAANDVYFVESSYALLHWDGTSITRTPMPGVATIAGTASGDAWLTGEDGWIRHRAP